MSVLDKSFFERHQKKVLFFTNLPIGRLFLRLESMGHRARGKKILRITPNSILYVENGQAVEQFHIYNEYALSLSRLLFWLPVVKFERDEPFVLRPAYQLAFVAVLAFLVKEIPSLLPVFGAVTTAFVPQTGSGGGNVTVDGRVCIDTLTTWAAARGATSAQFVNDTETTQLLCRAQRASATAWAVYRTIYTFDTSSIGAGAVVSAVTFGFYRNDAFSGLSNADSTSAVLVSASPTSNNAIVIGDYDIASKIGTTSFGSIAFSATTNAAYNTITGNASAIAAVSVTGISKYAVITELDRSNTSPSSDNKISTFFADNGSNKPTLTVTYALATNSNFLMFM